MATTIDGLPYAVGTDLVRDGDNVFAALSAAISGLTRWLAVGRFDGQIEGNGYARLGPGVAWPSGKLPFACVAMGINEQFRPTWDGMADGAGILLKVYKPDNTQWPSGSTVAFYFICARPKGSGT